MREMTDEEREAYDTGRRMPTIPSQTVGGISAWPFDEVVLVQQLCDIIDRLTAADEGDDGDAVTEEWLRSVGFARELWNMTHPELHGGLALGCYADDTNYWCWFIGGQFIVALKTRADVRRLCAALGIELPPPNGA